MRRGGESGREGSASESTKLTRKDRESTGNSRVCHLCGKEKRGSTLGLEERASSTC